MQKEILISEISMIVPQLFMYMKLAHKNFDLKKKKKKCKIPDKHMTKNICVCVNNTANKKQWIWSNLGLYPNSM